MKCSVMGQNIAKGGKLGLWEADKIESKLKVSDINERIVIKRIIVILWDKPCVAVPLIQLTIEIQGQVVLDT